MENNMKKLANDTRRRNRIKNKRKKPVFIITIFLLSQT